MLGQRARRTAASPCAVAGSRSSLAAMDTTGRAPWLTDERAPADAVGQLYRGRLDGIILKQLLTPDECATCMAAVVAHGRWEPVYPDPHAPKSIGVMYSPTPIHPTGPPRDYYFPDAAQDARWVREALHPLIPRFEEKLSALSGTRSVGSLDQPEQHRLATVREMDVGYGAPAHVDTYEPSDGLASLFAHTDRTTQLSWYVLLQPPGSGGELEVADRSGAMRVVPLEAGDGVLFDGGRLQHCVTCVASSPPRVTVGGFAGIARTGNHVYYWS